MEPLSNIVAEENLAILTGGEPHSVFSRLVICDKTGQLLRQASAEFYPEGQSVSGESRSMWNLSLKSDGQEYIHGLAYSAAAVSGVDNIPDDWPANVRELIQEMAEIRSGCALPIIPLASQDASHIQYIQTLLDDLQGETIGSLLSKFRNKRNQPITEWPDLSRTAYLYEKLPQTAIKYYFPSLEVAAMKLCNERYLEHKWQESVVAGLSGGTNVTFVVVGVGLILAFVRYSGRKQLKKKAQLDDRMAIPIEVEFDESSAEEDEIGNDQKKSLKSKGKLASNRLGIQSDFGVLLEKPHKGIFKIASKYGEHPTFMTAYVKFAEDARLARLEVSAVHTLCQEFDNPHTCCLPKTLPVHLQETFSSMMLAAHQFRFTRSLKLWFTDL